MVQRLYLLLACLCCSLSAAERVINACDSTTQWTTSNSATVTATTRGTSSAVSIAIPANTSNGPGSATGVGEAILHSGSPFYPAGATDTYDGIRFWVKGNGTTKWGNIQLRFGDNWSRAWALFPVTTSWTEVTIPWREFYQQNYEGTMDNHYKTIFRLVFTSGFNQRDGHPLRNIPAHGYDIDDIRFVSGITLPPTPPITGLSIKNTMAKLQSGQPVKIVVMGASISWGLKLSSPATEAWPYKLEQLLRARYGNGVSVVNAAIPGFNSFEGGCALGWFANDREPVDLIMAADWCYNDYPDAEFVTGGVGEIANNYRNFFEQVLRRGNSEVLHVQSGLHCEPGNFDYMDAANTALSNLCDAMNVYKADVYGNFKAKGQPWLTANYYTFSGDYGHYNADAHAAAAQIVMDSIIAAERFTLTVVNGNGGGSYASAATVTISANAPPAGQIFDRWTGATVANATASTTTLTMPAAATTVTATYKAAPAGNRPPTLSSGPGASPNPTFVGVAVNLTAAASDPDGDALTYTWELGGSVIGTGSTISHTFPAAGFFIATLTVSDGNGGTATGSVTVQVNSSGTGGGGNDDDGDVNPPSGSGGGSAGGSGGTPLPMTVTKISGSVSFTATSKDASSISGTILNLPAGFDPSGIIAELNLGGAAVAFVLDARGRGKSTNGSFSLTIKGKRNRATGKIVFAGGNVPFKAKLQRGTWSDDWSDEGVKPDLNATGQPMAMLLTLKLGGVLYGTQVNATYSGKAGKGGKFKN